MTLRKRSILARVKGKLSKKNLPSNMPSLTTAMAITTRMMARVVSTKLGPKLLPGNVEARSTTLTPLVQGMGRILLLKPLVTVTVTITVTATVTATPTTKDREASLLSTRRLQRLESGTWILGLVIPITSVSVLFPFVESAGPSWN
jgi:hypothetical protein